MDRMWTSVIFIHLHKIFPCTFVLVPSGVYKSISCTSIVVFFKKKQRKCFKGLNYSKIVIIRNLQCLVKRKLHFSNPDTPRNSIQMYFHSIQIQNYSLFRWGHISFNLSILGRLSYIQIEYKKWMKININMDENYN